MIINRFFLSFMAMFSAFLKKIIFDSDFMILHKICLAACLLLLTHAHLGAQLRIAPEPQDTLKKSITLHNEDNQIIDATTDPPTQFLNGNVKIFHSNTFMYCDSAVLRGNMLYMKHNVVMLQNDTILIFADSLRYNSDDGMAFLFGEIILENGAKNLTTTYLEYDVRNKIANYTKNAKLEDGKSTLISKRGTYLLNDKKVLFGGNVFIEGENFSLISDSIAYFTETQITEYLAPVRIRRDTTDIYSLGGWFDLDDKIGDFIGNAQYKAGTTTALADTISYDGENDIVTLKSENKRSIYISEKDTAYANTIFYDKKEEIFRLTGDSYYKNEKNEVRGEKILYEKQSENFKVSGRSYISDPPTIIEADEVDYDKKLKYGKADGMVIWRDTSAKTTVYADHIVYRGDENYMKATNDSGRPLFTTLIDQDTLYMRADTLKSIRIIKERKKEETPDLRRQSSDTKETINLKNSKDKDILDVKKIRTESDSLKPNELIITQVDVRNSDSLSIEEKLESDSFMLVDIPLDSLAIMDTIDYFIGDNNVRMYKNGMQSICDSLTYSIKDSVFMLSGIPFVWSDSTQISGDIIHLFLKSKKVDRLTSGENALILTSEDLVFFNQIRGKFLESFFLDGKLNKMDIDGNAEALYYILDKEKAYIGVNKTECSNMSFWFKDNKISDIRFYKEPSSKVTPMNKADHEAMKVKGFIWNAQNRPMSQEDL